MKTVLDNNTISPEFFSITLDSIFESETFVLKSVKRAHSYVDNLKTDTIEAIVYELVDPNTFSTFRLKVPGNSPVIEPEKYKETEELLHVSVPLSKTSVRLYKIEFGKAFVTISAPYVKLVN